MRFFVEPKILSKRLIRRVLKSARRYGLEIVIKTYRRRIINDRIVYESSVAVSSLNNDLINSLRHLGVKLIKKEKRELISGLILADLETNYSNDIPIGISEDNSYVIFISKNDQIITDDFLIAAYISRTYKSSLWIDNLGIDGIQDFNFHELNGIPIKALPRSIIEEFSRIYAQETLGLRHSKALLNILISQREELGFDEEIPLVGEESRFFSDLFEWKAINKEEDNFPDHSYLDLCGVPTHVFLACLILGSLTTKEFITVSTPQITHKLKKYLMIRQSYAIVLPTIVKSEDLANVYISRKDKKCILERAVRFKNDLFYLKETFIPIYYAIEGD